MQDLVDIGTMAALDLAHLLFRLSVERAQLRLMMLSAKITLEQPMPADARAWDLLNAFSAEHRATDKKIYDRIEELAQKSGHDDIAAMATATRAAGAEELNKVAQEDVAFAKTRGGLLLLVLVPCTLGRWALMSVDSCDAACAPPPLLGPCLVSFVDPTAVNRAERMDYLARLPKGAGAPQPAPLRANGAPPVRIATANVAPAAMQAPAIGECRRDVPDDPTSLPVATLQFHSLQCVKLPFNSL